MKVLSESNSIKLKVLQLTISEQIKEKVLILAIPNNDYGDLDKNMIEIINYQTFSNKFKNIHFLTKVFKKIFYYEVVVIHTLFHIIALKLCVHQLLFNIIGGSIA